MRVVGAGKLAEFSLKHADAAATLNVWLAEAEAAEWRSPNDIRARYRSASFLAGNRVVFNIRGNNYRLVAKINYELGVALIELVGTHAEYDRWQL